MQCINAKCMQLIMMTEKQGSCPPLKNEVSTVSSGHEYLLIKKANLCIDMCTGHDYLCPGTQKCCLNDCGKIGSCLPAQYLSHVSSLILPEIPDNVTVYDTLRTSKIGRIKWQMRFPPGANETVQFVVEMREHYGYQFFEWKMSKWTNISFHLDLSSESVLFATKYTQ